MAEPITCKAMVAFGVNDLREEEIIVAPPKAGEVSGAIASASNTTHQPAAHLLISPPTATHRTQVLVWDQAGLVALILDALFAIHLAFELVP